MRAKVEIYTEKIPLGYRMMFVSVIKHSLEKTNKEYFNRLYNFGDRKNKKMKPFVFSTYLENYEIGEEYIKINGKVNLIISTPDTELFINLYNGLLNIKRYKFKNEYTLNIGKIILLKEKEIISETVEFKAISPIVLRDKKGNFLRTEDERYTEQLNYIADLSLKIFRGSGLTRRLDFTPLNYEKVVVKERITGFKKSAKKDIFYITGYRGTFRLCGGKEDLKLLYALGLGFRRSEGFGNIEVNRMGGEIVEDK